MNNTIISSINAYDSSPAFNCIFNPNKEEIFLSSSDEEIKIFDLTLYTYIQNSHYNYGDSIMKWKSDKEYVYCDNKGIVIKEFNTDDKIFIPISEKINDFYFINDNNLITIEKKYIIKKWDIKKPNSPIQEIMTDENIEYSLYDKNFNYLYLFYENGFFKIIDLEEFKFINIKEYKEYFKNPILLNENLLNKENHEIAKILYNKKKIINLKKEKNYPILNIEKQTDAPNDFTKRIKTVIYDYYDILRKEENQSIDENEKIEKKNIKKFKMKL